MKRIAAIAIAIAVTAGLALLAAACGGSSGPRVASVGASSTGTTASASSTSSSPLDAALAFARCMRAHGVPDFPDPGSNGRIPKLSLEQLGVSSGRFRTAQRACEHLLPNGGQPPSQAQRQRVGAQGLQFARCVRAHGVPGFPDPDSTGRIPDPSTVGIDQGSPTFEAANRACARYRPPYIPSNSTYRSWARTHTSGSGS